MRRVEHREKEWIFPFVSYFPEEELTEELPLIIQLHGAGERGNGQENLEFVDVHGFSAYLSTHEHRCVVVMPQCPENTFWVAKIESIIRFIVQITENYKINKNKIYLTGLSMGGYGTWYTAMAKPDIFAAIAPVCGGGMAWNADSLKMPIWAFHGAEDDIVSPQQSDEMVEKLKSLNVDIIYSRIDGVGHNAWDYAYNEKLMNWLLSKEK